jgi:hypothetical protein
MRFAGLGDVELEPLVAPVVAVVGDQALMDHHASSCRSSSSLASIRCGRRRSAVSVPTRGDSDSGPEQASGR